MAKGERYITQNDDESRERLCMKDEDEARGKMGVN
jgi:hypothetical protein